MDYDRAALQAISRIHRMVSAIAMEAGLVSYAMECQAKADAETWQVQHGIW